MSIQIGKLLSDGRVRHIKVLHGAFSEDLVRKLRVFYSGDKRVDALLSLGDVLTLGPSPYAGWTGDKDAVHCFSRIRDGREAPHRFAARIADNIDIFSRMEDMCLLFDDGKWYRVSEGESRKLSYPIENTASHDSMESISVYINRNARIERIDTPKHWRELPDLAERESRILYVYRGQRLVTIVRSSNLKKKLYATQ